MLLTVQYSTVGRSRRDITLNKEMRNDQLKYKIYSEIPIKRDNYI